MTSPPSAPASRSRAFAKRALDHGSIARSFWSSTLHRVSARKLVVASLLLLALIAGGQLVFNLRAFTLTAFMLRRAETSYRQLAGYQQLSINLLDYMRGAGAVTTAGTVLEQRRDRVRASLASLELLTKLEVGLVKDGGGADDATGDTVERERLSRIRTNIQAMFEAPPAAIGRLYEVDVDPLLVAAVEGEQDEVEAVERSMRRLQTSIRLYGPLGVLLQIATAGLVVVIVNRVVIDAIARLVADIRRLGRGELAHRIEAKRRDEFGLLARHINRMAGSLERGRRSLEDSNSRLEEIVAERTQALSDRNAELKEIDDSRRRFFADVSHELRTPLTAIVGEADVTLRAQETAAQPYRAALSSILANSTYLNRRIDDLMALARSSDGTIELQSGTVDLNLVAAEAIDEIQSLARINDVEVQFEPFNAPLSVRGDRARLRQCLMILLDNAVKFSRGGAPIVVTLLDHGTRAEIAVADRGRGIAAEDLPHVFERYYQARIGQRMGGTGLGLAIARNITEAHRGTIAATRGPTGGATITIVLPLEGAIA